MQLREKHLNNKDFSIFTKKENNICTTKAIARGVKPNSSKKS
jgi:hypothetical protein